MAKYILLLHENPANYTDLGPADMQAMIERYSAWGRSIAEAGKMHSGMKLGDNGGWHMRRGGSGIAVTDGPYAEAKDVVGGFYVIEAADEAEAQSIAGGCPHLERGWIEIRPIDIG